jgi:hypothetical protein
MRKVSAGLFISLDGVVEAPDKWQEHFYGEMMTAMISSLQHVEKNYLCFYVLEALLNAWAILRIVSKP